MKTILTFTLFNIKLLWKNRITAMFLWLSPIFFLFIVGLIGSEGLEKERFVDPFQLVIVNEDPTFETRLVISQLTEGEHLNSIMRTVESDRKEAKQLLEENKAAAVVYIPRGFSKDVAKGINTPVTVVGNEQRPLQAALVRQVMESAAGFTSAAQSGINTVHYFMKEMDFTKEERKKEFKKNVVSFSLDILGRGNIFEEKKQAALYQINLWHYYAVSFLTLMMMVWSFTGLFLFNNQMNKALSRRLLTVGFSSYHGAAAKMTFVLIVVLMSSMITVILLMISGMVNLHIESLRFTGGFILTAFLFAVFFVMIDTLLADEKLYLLVGLACLFVGTTAGGHIIPAVYFPGWLEQINVLTINAWALEYMLTFFYQHSAQTFLKLSFILLSIACSFSLITIAILYWRMRERRRASGCVR
ncbi:ABC transporter permease [Bacillus sp. B190/17]|uniref:ABC transporter permease n=1 Tax=Bacillus lumedeiriae TaxID=3058829 RepID=A0ABW8I6U5_9BACI